MTAISAMLMILSSMMIPGRFATWSWTRKTGGRGRKSWLRRNGSNGSVGPIRGSTLTFHVKRFKAGQNSIPITWIGTTKRDSINITIDPDTGLFSRLSWVPGIFPPSRERCLRRRSVPDDYRIRGGPSANGMTRGQLLFIVYSVDDPGEET